MTQKVENVATFELQPYRYHHNGFSYWFEWNLKIGDNKKQIGFGKCDFGKIQKYPNEYIGNFRGFEQKKELFFEGRKLNKKEIEKLFQDSTTKKAFLKEQIQIFAQRKNYEIADNLDILFNSDE